MRIRPATRRTYDPKRSIIATLTIAARDANVLEGVMELNVGSKARPCTYEIMRNIASGTVDVQCPYACAYTGPCAPLSRFMTHEVELSREVGRPIKDHVEPSCEPVSLLRQLQVDLERIPYDQPILDPELD